MKQGTKVKVVAERTGHQFYIGEIVQRKAGELDGDISLGFYSENSGLWYMDEDEYEVVDKQYPIDLLKNVLSIAKSQGFSDNACQSLQKTINKFSKEI